MKSVYAGLGLIGSGAETVEELGRKLARKAKISEKDGERIAKKLRARSERATRTLNRVLEREVSSMVDSLHAHTKRRSTKAGAKHRSSGGRKSHSRRHPGHKGTAKASHG